MKADLIIHNAAIPAIFAAGDAIAIGAGRILAVGSGEDLRIWIGPHTRSMDVQGATLMPGFVDSHVHLFGGGLALRQVNVASVRDEAALTETIRSFAAENPGTDLVQAYAANYTILGDNRPTRHDLDRILPDRPFAITATDFHCVWANTCALELAGILQGGDAGPGAEVVLGADGLASGELREFAAMRLVLQMGRAGGRDQLGLTGDEPGTVTAEQRDFDKATLCLAMAHCASLGITTAVNMDGNRYQVALLRELDAEGRLPIRVSLPIVLTAVHGPKDVAKALMDGSEMLRFNRIKMFMDGVFDTWTAFVTDAYPDRPGFAAHPLFAPEAFNAICIEADRLGLQIAVHAVGDGAVRCVLDGYQAALNANGRRDSRHRIEHIDTLHPEDLPRLAALGVIASMQPVHPPGSAGLPLEPTISLMGRARWPLAFAWRAIRERGVPIAFGTDWPVSPLDPLYAIHCALTRQPWSGAIPDQRLTLEECLLAYTSAGAAADFAEGQRGSLAVGMAADLVVIDGCLDDLATQAPKASVRATICNGRVVYSA
ncbi:MAG: amidohydrolase [Paracoccaceae bacterium]